MTLFALTDHDTVDGVPEALAAARAHRSSSSPRSSCQPCTAPTRTCTSSATGSTTPTARLLDALEDFRADRVRRIFAMADRLRELGFALDDAALRAARRRPGARTSPTRCSRTRRTRSASGRGDDGKNALFPAYLVPGAAAYVRRSRPTVPRRST